MERTTQKGLAHILARELASNIAVPMFLVDTENTLIFYNEAASPWFGGPFGQTGELRSGDWNQRFNITRPDGIRYDRSELPLVIAQVERRPAHGMHEINAPDGRRALIEVTAIPLLSSPDDMVGVLAFAWEVDRDPDSPGSPPEPPVPAG